jgi:hypothetical protein
MSDECRHSADADRLALARARDRINRERFAIRADFRALAADERRLEERLAELGATQARAKALIEGTWRTTHFGAEPKHVRDWRTPATSTPTASRRETPAGATRLRPAPAGATTRYS